MRAIGTENAWFTFNGTRNDELNVRMLSMPTRPHPARKGKVIDIPGADGDLWQDGGGRKRIIVPIRVMAMDNANIDEVNAWLDGSGDLVFGDEPERLYHARITKEFSRSNRSQRLRGQEFTVSFDCEPYRYKADPSGDNQSFVASAPFSASVSVTNPGTADALPLIRVSNSSEGCSITIAGNTLSVAYCAEPIYVDCAAMRAYIENDDGTLSPASMYVSGDWLRIPPGLNTVIIAPGDYSNSASITITPRWRWL